MEDVTQDTRELRYLYTGLYASKLYPAWWEPVFSTELFNVAIVGPPQMKISLRDGWGNVRIPSIETLSRNGGADDRQWLAVPNISQPETFSSLTGLPIVGLPASAANVITNFTLETLYMSLSCSPWDQFPKSDTRLAFYKSLWTGLDPFRRRRGDLGGSVAATQNVTFFVDARMPRASQANFSAAAGDAIARVLHFVAARPRHDGAPMDLSATNCSVLAKYVEVAISCTRARDCKAVQMRRSRRHKCAQSSTPLDLAVQMTLLADRLASWELLDLHPSDVELFLHNSLRCVHMQPDDATVNMSEVPPPLFSSRLQLVLNSW